VPWAATFLRGGPFVTNLSLSLELYIWVFVLMLNERRKVGATAGLWG
jgi:hypothetical protein